MSAVETRGFTLAPWQEAAVHAWIEGDGRARHRGTLEVVTGGGKTLIALACLAHVATSSPDVRLVVVVPTEALARQWRIAIARYTTLHESETGLLGAGSADTLESRRALVAVLNTASERLPEMSRRVDDVMLVVDECHRAGAPSFSRVLDTRAAHRLGLSATPDREELDDDGEPLDYDEQKVGQSLGGVVFRFTLRDARLAGWLPDYDIHHHGLELTPDERARYEAASRRVDDLADRLRSAGIETSRALKMQGQRGDIGDLVRSYVAATAARKDLLYRAVERHRVASELVRQAMANGKERVLLFHERVAQAVELASSLQENGIEGVILEHSRLTDRERIAALDAFRSGAKPVLVSVKSLIEGIDVPEADVGISVASTSSVRQRIQSLGRVLRRRFEADAPRKHAEMHVLYVADSVDELIYTKEDWSDLTGEGANEYWRWELGGGRRRMDGPPASPRPTEEQEWERLGRAAPSKPTEWLGSLPGLEYSVDTMGTVTNASGTVIANPQQAGELVELVRGRPGGRFRVTPEHRLVLVWGDAEEGGAWFVAGQLDEAFTGATQEFAAITGGGAAAMLGPGDNFAGPDDRSGGSFKISQKRGGVIERRVQRGTEFALTGPPAPGDLAANAERVLAAWKRALSRGITFHLTADGHAWYLEGGAKRHLAYARGGFAWPSELEDPR